MNLRSWLVGICILGLYLVSRYSNLSGLPIFNDEAIYLRWATIIQDDPKKIFVSAIDGKTPFFMWVVVISLDFFNDVLLAGRNVSILAGGFTLLGIYLIGRKLFSNAVGLVAAFIYLSLPFSLIHQRLALTDSLATTFVTWLILFSISFSLAGNNGWIKSLALGVTLGLGFLTKTPNLIFFIFPFLALFLFSNYRDSNLWLKLFVAYVIGLVVILPYLLHEPPYKLAGIDKILHNVSAGKKIISVISLNAAWVFPYLKEWLNYLASDASFYHIRYSNN